MLTSVNGINIGVGKGYIMCHLVFGNMDLERSPESLPRGQVPHPGQLILLPIEVIHNDTIEEVEDKERADNDKEAKVQRPYRPIPDNRLLLDPVTIHAIPPKMIRIFSTDVSDIQAYIISSQPSVVATLNIVFIASPMLSKLESSFIQSPP